ncbi:ATP-binding protein [Nocardia acidivorans]|uniref:ATP-binding protein n=1 Tax=Nocardia acidivorans TaxID=404580 RepID=UPI00083228BE|nr:ATP-binding protein [Nocardia acidivorans]
MSSTDQMVRSRPHRREISVPGEASQIGVVRRIVRNWLERCEIDPTQAYDVVLAVNEAMTNAIEHGYRFRPGIVRVAGELTEEDLRVTVTDEGSWKPIDIPENPHRGRGLELMRVLMTEVTVRIEDGGTTVDMRTKPIYRRPHSPRPLATASQRGRAIAGRAGSRPE